MQGRAALLLAALASPVAAGDWFMHPLGELRAYHGDWLAVCDGAGAGPCRAVHMVLEPGETFVGRARVAVIVQGSAYGWELDAQDLNGPSTEVLRITIDGAEVTMQPPDLRAGAVQFDNVYNAVTIANSARAQQVVADMRAGRWMDLDWGSGAARVSLRGITAALTAIDTQLARSAKVAH